MTCMIYARCVVRTFQQGTIAFQPLNNFLYHFLYFSFQFVLDSIKSTMNIPTNTTYMTSFPKKKDITGALTKFSSLTTFWITGQAASEPTKLRPLEPSTQDPYATSILLPLKSTTIYPVHPLLSLETHPIRKVNSA